MAAAWTLVFDLASSKTVTYNDKEKAAYEVTNDQERVLKAAGMVPKHATEHSLTVLGEARSSINASYYLSKRTGSGRPPDPRMGRGFISAWLQVGDRVVIASIGNELFVFKEAPAFASVVLVQQEIARRASAKTVLALALRAKGKPQKLMTTTEVFVRNPYVVSAALARSKGTCEMPSCAQPLFNRADNGLP